MNIKNNIEIVLQKISVAKQNANRIDDVKLIAVSKTKPSDLIIEAHKAGQIDFGENKVQEALQKAKNLQELQINWHLIGHLQTNKAKDAVKFAKIIHSVDSLRLAHEINKHAANINKTQEILLQINTSNEDTKSGAEPQEALELLKKVSDLPNVKTTGFMTIGKLTENYNEKSQNEIRDCFKILKNIFQEAKILKLPNVEIKNLSMGMSGDYEIAIAEGANMLRVGSSIFGGR